MVVELAYSLLAPRMSSMTFFRPLSFCSALGTANPGTNVTGLSGRGAESAYSVDYCGAALTEATSAVPSVPL